MNQALNKLEKDVDVVKAKKKTLLPTLTGKSVGLFLVVALIFLVIWSFAKDSSMAIERQDLLIEQVVLGDLEQRIEGYGVLSSDKQQLITSYSSATVKEIVLKPGAQVTKDSVILRLENPELEQAVQSAEQELKQTQANLRQLKLNNQREKLNESATLAELMAAHENAALNKEAEEKLVEQGIVSQLTYQQSVLEEKQLNQRIGILKQRIIQLDLVHEESVNIQQERVNQQHGRVDIAENRLDRLTVKAGFDGVLQRLSVELGQSLAPGQELALIGSVSDLIALIRVPQSQAQLVSLGDKTVIDTRRDKIEGIVSRIDPIVANNTVEIEIALPADLPASARPQLSVDGTIIADTLENVTYIRRPAGMQSDSQASLFRVAQSNDQAHRQEVRFGVQTGQFIQILSGASAGERFIISDLSNMSASSDTLVIN